MIDLSKLSARHLQSTPFSWAEIGALYSPEDAKALAETYPHDHFKTVSGYGGEKDYEYEARQLIAMGTQQVVNPQALSPHWLALSKNLCSSAYRQAMSALTGVDLSQAPMEANVFHYGPGANLGPHPDLADKLVTHILYFNETWDPADGGCLQILASADPSHIVAEVAPVIGNSAILVRANNSWHAVSRVVDDCHSSRRSLTVTFYRPGATSSMWPADDREPLHNYGERTSGALPAGDHAHG
ncbi:2OG-Fe(II) oxygenase [Pseudomonas sp. PDNC002]|uniref:2OG-Fe(II) oxygenase family protein n=1 Tax=Pseudomonas sp. PDNC002 TaxID=2811422 RepID=UPI0019626100|nr:2OG-Fe(II) oxygenase family protein [Pseudomonas sp. PDNC002]QRY77338.1 2OG-Fe(II) oxygenase [Pseudomonas sp. PDNC002]